MAQDDLDPQEQAVQYVLGELPAPEARALERRMATDAALAAEVRRLQGTLALLPFSTLADPPPALKGRIMDAAEVQHRRRQLRQPRRVVWSRYAAAIAATVALALGVDSYRTHQELSIERQVAQLLLEPNVVKTFAIAGTAGGVGAVGTVALDLDSKRGAVVLRGAPALQAGQTYRLWAQVADRAVPCGDFAAAGDGTVRAAFSVPVDAYTAPIGRIFVTVEPSGPGEKPTGPVVMQSA